MQNPSELPLRLRVFLCHSSNDKSAVRTLYAKLLKDGFEPWLDTENLLPGEDWEREIPLAVRNSHVVIVCLSEGSINKTGFIQKEIRFALDVADEQTEGTIYIIPLRLEECSVPDRLRRWHWVNFFEDNGYEKLKQSLERRAKSLNLETPLNITVPEDSLRYNPQTSSLALVMKGGGVKGLAYVGAIKELEKYYKFDRFIGTSAGAIAAVLLGAGYTINELESLLANKNFYDFLDAKWYKLPTNLLLKKGLYPADKFTEWIDKLLSKKLDSPIRVTLGQLPFRVTIYASRRDKNALIFDSHDPETKNKPAAFAVRCSMSIPFIFTPQMDEGLRVLDGGMRNNYPIDVLLRNNTNTDFIGLYLGSEHFEGQERETSLIKDLFTIWTEANDVESLKLHLQRTVIIDPRPISTVDFRLTDEAKKFLLKVGRAAAFKFLLKQDKLNDIEKNRIKNEYEKFKIEVEQNRQVLINGGQKKREGRVKILGLLVVIFFLILIVVWSQPYAAGLFGGNQNHSTNSAENKQATNSFETATPTMQATISTNSNQQKPTDSSENKQSPDPSKTEKPEEKPTPTSTAKPDSTQRPNSLPRLRRCEDLTYEEIQKAGNKKIPCVE